MGEACRRREEQRKRWETSAEQEKEGMGGYVALCMVGCRKGSTLNGICRSPAQIRRKGRNDCRNAFMWGDVLGSH